MRSLDLAQYAAHHPFKTLSSTHRAHPKPDNDNRPNIQPHVTRHRPRPNSANVSTQPGPKVAVHDRWDERLQLDRNTDIAYEAIIVHRRIHRDRPLFYLAADVG